MRDAPGDGEGAIRLLLLLLVVSTLLRLFYLPVLHLVPQETYYWLFAKNLDLSYFDHPPMVAWSIALSTLLGGDTVFFVRLPAVVFLTGVLALSFVLAARLFGDRRVALCAVAVMSLTPVFNLNGVIVTPDSPLLFFWALTLVALERALSTARWWWWQISGVALGLAMLSKYTAVLLPAGAFLLLLLSARHRRWLLSPQPYAATLTATLVFSPVLLWNARHDWASFAFQSSRRVGKMESFDPIYSLELLGTQMTLVTPLVFAGVIYALWLTGRRWWLERDDALLFLLVFSLPALALFAAVSLRTLVKMNWPAPAYIAGILALAVAAAWHTPRLSGWWRRVGLTVAAGMTLLLFLLPVAPLVSLGRADTWTGWPQLAQSVEEMRSEIGDPSFVFSPDHKISSELTFILGPEVPVLTENTFGEPARQYEFWTEPEAHIGWDAVFVYSDVSRISASDLARIRVRFRALGEPRRVLAERGGVVRREFVLLPCFDYRGPDPE